MLRASRAFVGRIPPRAVLLLVGAALFGALIVETGPGVLLASVAQLSWRFLIVLVFPFTLVTLCDTLGWRFAFPADGVPFFALAAARLGGDAFNATTPTAQLGGDAVKVWSLRGHVALDQSVPSVIVAKTAMTTSLAMFLLFGLGCAVGHIPARSPLFEAMVSAFVVEIVAVVGFVSLQVSGALTSGSSLLARLGRLAPIAAALGRVDGALGHYYRHHPLRLALSVAASFLGCVLGALEVWLILDFLGVPISLRTAIITEAANTAVHFATFFVPAGLGVVDGGLVAIGFALGLPPSAMLSASLVCRLRELVWVGFGFLALLALRRRPLRAPAHSTPPMIVREE